MKQIVFLNIPGISSYHDRFVSCDVAEVKPPTLPVSTSYFWHALH